MVLLKYAGNSNKIDREQWINILADSKRIEILDALEKVDFTVLLDDGESFEDFISSDELSCFYLYKNEDKEVIFLETSGQDFIFSNGGLVPSVKLKSQPSYIADIQLDPMAKVLAPSNSALLGSAYGFEEEGVLIYENLEYIQSTNPRFRLLENGMPVAGIRTSNGVVDSLYVKFGDDYRRRGYATRIFNMARSFLGELEHSTSLSKDGVEFVNSMKNKKSQNFELS